jgi:N-methylhydantoinase A
MRLLKDRVIPYFNEMGKNMRLTPSEAAEGVLDVANTAMERAIRVISVEKGYDPREFTLFSFGGAGGMHAAFLARLLNIPKVLVPPNPGILSAIGMIMADVIKDYSLTIMQGEEETSFEILDAQFADIEKRGMDDLMAEGIAQENMLLERYLDMRYQGQSYEIIVPFDEQYVGDFHILHEKTYGYRNEDTSVEIVNIRLRARGIPEKPAFPRALEMTEEIPRDAFLGESLVIFEHKPLPAKVVAREKLLSGNRIDGPAIIVEYTSTIVVPPFAAATVDELGNMILEISASS